MAVLAAAQLLDELMGRNRNVAPNERVKELNWEDPEYCNYFLAKFCPHDLFVNTRVDLGACSKVHDEEAKKLFDKAKRTHPKKLQYQEEFLRFCSSMMNDVEKRIAKGKHRLALSALNKTEMQNVTPAQSQQNQEQIDILNARINDLEAEAEQAGTDGNVEQAQGLMKLCDQLKEERDTLRRQIENGHFSATAELAAAQEKQMELCEVCGAFLIVGDAPQRIDDHLMGKQHMGYSRLRAAVEEVSEIVRAAKDKQYGGRGFSDDKRERDKDRSERERDRKFREKRSKDGDRSERRDRESHRERRQHREKERDKERDRSSRHQESSRHRHHRHHRH